MKVYRSIFILYIITFQRQRLSNQRVGLWLLKDEKVEINHPMKYVLKATGK